MKESQTKSVLKSISWRITSLISCGLYAIWATGSLVMAFKLAAFEIVGCTIIYYIHERVWAKVNTI